MKRIKLSERQINLIKESMRDKKQVIKITESQYDILTKSLQEGKMGGFERKVTNNLKNVNKIKLDENENGSYDMEELEFYEQMMYFINAEFGGDNDSSAPIPEAIAATGVTAKKLKLLLIGHGVIKMQRDENGDPTIKVMRKNLSKGLSKIKDEVFKDINNDESQEPNDKIEENYPAGAENDPNAPYNQNEEEYSSIDVNLDIIGLTDEFALINNENKIILIDIDPIYQELKHTDFPEEIITEYLDDVVITSDVQGFMDTKFYGLYITQENIEEITYELLESGFDDMVEAIKGISGNMIHEDMEEFDRSNDDDEFLDQEYDENGIAETTTTGSVGGSFEIPGAWSKNPKKPRHSDKPAVQGGKFIKPAIGDKMDTIREHIEKLKLTLPKFKKIKDNGLNEDIGFKRGSGKIFMVSDSDDPKVRSNETFSAKDYAKEHGFKWDKVNKMWYCDEDNIENVKQLANILKNCKESFESLEEIAEMIQQMDGDAPQDIQAAKETGTKLTSKDEVAQLFEDFYGKLDGDLDENQYIKISAEYIKFVSHFKSKFGKKYSPKNLMLIFIQKPNATAVGTFNDWKKVNRSVVKGQRSIKIWAPIIKDINKAYKNSEEEAAETGEEFTYKKEKDLVGFKTMPVFDISQTKNNDGTEDPQQLETHWQPSNDPNEKAQELSGILKDVIQDEGIKLTDDDSRHGEGGFSANNWINISKGTAGERLFSVLVHEFAHELLHWEKGPFGQAKRGELDSATKEVQAEGVAIGIMNFYGFDVTPGKVYLQSWRQKGSDGVVTIKDNLETMTKISGYIVKKITEKLEEKHSGAGDRIIKPENK